jgi:hypothetical protein
MHGRRACVERIAPQSVGFDSGAVLRLAHLIESFVLGRAVDYQRFPVKGCSPKPRSKVCM